MASANITKHLIITTNINNNYDNIEVSQDCWLIVIAILKVLSMTGKKFEDFGASEDALNNIMHDGRALSEVADLGVFFASIAWNSLDEYLLKQEVKNDA